jgi:hypothetical protein
LRNLQLPLVVAAILAVSCLSSLAQAGPTPAREISFPIPIHWNKQKSVSKYRLQIAADEKFQNVFFDRRVVGDSYLVSELSPGPYFWRVAPADSLVGQFSKPTRVFVSGGVVIPVRLPNRPTHPTRSHSLPAIVKPKVH